MVQASTTRLATAAAPTDAAQWALCACEHAACFACRPVATGGLGLCLGVQSDGSVAARWTCPPGGESYRGVVHALFARGIVARTAELKIRYRHSAGVGEALIVRAWLRRSFGPLHELEAEIRDAGAVCAHAWAKFMADKPARCVSANVANCDAVRAD